MFYNAVIRFAEKRFMHTECCFREDISVEPFLVIYFEDDAVKSCRSCGIDATRENTLLAREQLDIAKFSQTRV
jgi:hypothetical protein